MRVFGDERQRVATLVREGLPWALLAPAAALERLLVDALTQAGQVGGKAIGTGSNGGSRGACSCICAWLEVRGLC